MTVKIRYTERQERIAKRIGYMVLFLFLLFITYTGFRLCFLEEPFQCPEEAIYCSGPNPLAMVIPWAMLFGGIVGMLCLLSHLIDTDIEFEKVEG